MAGRAHPQLLRLLQAGVTALSVRKGLGSRAKDKPWAVGGGVGYLSTHRVPGASVRPGACV